MHSRPFLRATGILLGAAWLVGGLTVQAAKPASEDQTLRNEYPGTPVPGLSRDELAAFERGEAFFSRLWKPADGLGPRLNADACMTCHHNPLPGGNEFAPARFVAHASACADMTGGHACQRLQLDAQGRMVAAALPAEHVVRKPQSLFGLGMLESIPERDIEALARAQERDPDGVRGMPGRTREGGIGRFGWKAHFARIDDFVASAFNAELGMTSSRYPSDGDGRDKPAEVSPHVIASTSEFLRMLAAPPLTPRGDVSRGRALMDSLRCTACHVPTLRTGDSPVRILSHRLISPYTDLLLHDMGPALAERIDEGNVGPARFRTPPLWGLNASGPPYLHDGRAPSVTQAILMHGGEAAKSVERFRALDAQDAQSLLRYLSSL